MVADRLGRLRRAYGGSMVTTATRLIDLPCRYGVHLLIALRLSLAEVGAFYIVFGAITIAAGLGRVGVDRALTREMARLIAGGDDAGARAAMRQAFGIIGLLSLGLALLAAALAWPIAHWVLHKPALTPLFLIAALMVVPQNLANAIAGALAGLHRVTQSQIIYTWAWPALFCLAALAMPLTAAHALALIAAAMTLATLVGAAMLWRALPPPPAHAPTATKAPLLATGLSLFSLELVQLCISAAPPFVLGIAASTDEVGLYAIAWRVVLVIYMFVSGVASMVSPRFARLYALGDRPGLAREAGKAIGFALALAVLPILVVTLEPRPILALFGPHFEPAASALRILLIGQLAATLTTTTPELLGMTGYARSLLKVNAVALLLLVAGLALLSGPLGADGAALATAATMVASAAMVTLAAQRKLGFSPIGALYAALRGREVAAASAIPAASGVQAS